MKVETYEAVVKNGQIKLADTVQLPEHTKVYVSVPGDFEPISVHIASPHLMQPEQSVDFEKVISEASTLDPWPPEPA